MWKQENLDQAVTNAHAIEKAFRRALEDFAGNLDVTSSFYWELPPLPNSPYHHVRWEGGLLTFGTSFREKCPLSDFQNRTWLIAMYLPMLWRKWLSLLHTNLARQLEDFTALQQKYAKDFPDHFHDLPRLMQPPAPTEPTPPPPQPPPAQPQEPLDPSFIETMSPPPLPAGADTEQNPQQEPQEPRRTQSTEDIRYHIPSKP